MDVRAFGSATQLALEIRDRRIGCLELLDFYLARAERHNPALNAIIAWQVDAARQRARDADAALAKGELWGPLHGIPMTVKESFNVAGLPTTFGNPLWKDNVATSNAVVVDRLFQNQQTATKITYSDFYRAVQQNQIAEVTSMPLPVETVTPLMINDQLLSRFARIAAAQRSPEIVIVPATGLVQRKLAGPLFGPLNGSVV